MSIKLSHRLLMLTFEKILTLDPMYGSNKLFICPFNTTSTTGEL